MIEKSTFTKGHLALLLVAFVAFLTALRLRQQQQAGIELDLYDSREKLQSKYDYIIVGGGTSGSVLASRLSEDSNVTVLLIEAGGNPEKNPFIDIPIFSDRQRDGEFDWSYMTVPQKHACLGHVEQMSKWSSGKGLGGSGILNYMEYLRGSRHDYDSWLPKKDGGAGGRVEKESKKRNGRGNNPNQQGWLFKDVLPYFIKSEDQRNKEFIKTVFHGFGGVLTVIDAYTSTLTNAILKEAFDEIGIKRKDLNGRSQFGWSPVQTTIRNGIRLNAYRSFLKRAIFRDNLHVVTKATAHKIVFDERRATAVEIKLGKEEETAMKIFSNREILLTAGTVGSAKLLLLSGVGPARHLEELKIPVVIDLPVGENLRDQVIGDGVEFYAHDQDVSMSVVKADNVLSSLAYGVFGTGMKSTPRFRESVANVKIKNHHHQDPVGRPLISLRFVASAEVYTSSMLNVESRVYNEIHGPVHMDSKEGFTIFPVLLHPKSVGTLRLKSRNPDDHPLIDPNYLADEDDVRILAAGYRFARKFQNTKALRNRNIVINNRTLSTCLHPGNYSSDDYLYCHLRQITLPGLSQTGTCKMGLPDDPSAVVDDELKIIGLENIRVADASVVPSTLSGNSYTTQIMIGERAADLVTGRNTVKAIKDYFRHLINMKHKKILEEE